MDRLAGRRKFEMETCAFAWPGLSLDGPAVLPDNAVGDGKTETRPLPGALGSEKRIIDSAQMFGRDTVSGVDDIHFDAVFAPAGDNFEHAAARLDTRGALHGV